MLRRSGALENYRLIWKCISFYQILEDLDEQLYCIQLQEEALQHKLSGESCSHSHPLRRLVARDVTFGVEKGVGKSELDLQ